MIKFNVINTKYNEKLKELYSKHPEVQAQASNKLMGVMFPQPLGFERVPAKLFYESILSDQPTAHELELFETFTKQYFNERIENIKRKS